MKLQAKLLIAAIAVALLAAILMAAHAHVIAQGRQIERAVWMKKEADRTAAENKALADHAETTRLEQIENNNKSIKVARETEKEITAVREFKPRHGLGSLRIPVAVCDSFAALPKAAGAGNPDGGTVAAIELPEALGRAIREFEQGNRELAKDADGEVAIARGLQNFAKVNGFYGEPEK